MAGETRTVAALVLVAVVAVTAIAGPAVAASTTVYPEAGEDLAVKLDWDSASVASGASVNLTIQDVTNATTADTATVTVRNASGTDTYWLSSAEYNIPSSSDMSTEVDVVFEDTTLGTTGHLEASPIPASQTLGVASGEGVSANITIDDAYPSDRRPLSVEVTAYDGTAELNSTTVDVDNSSASFAEMRLGLDSSTNATVVITNATDSSGSLEFAAFTGYNVSTYGDAVGGGGGDGGGSGMDSSSMYVSGAVVVAAGAYVAIKDD